MPRGVYERKPKGLEAPADGAEPSTKTGRKAKAPKPVGGGDLVATIDGEFRLVLIRGSEVTRFTADQTAEIAGLLSQHYE
jgi:hypothetical protein